MTETKPTEEFFKEIANEVLAVLKHHFIAVVQGEYIEDLKKRLKEGKIVVTLDFSENYTLHIQNAIQAQHWSKDQATLHVYVVYYKLNNKLKHENFVVISEYVNHDATGVNLFNGKLIEHLKKKLGENFIKKIFYFSDGAGSQYKNKFNFINLIEHEKEFGIPAEWHFFATSHGKGAVDGIGGSVKQKAYRASLQGNENSQITTPKQLFDWAVSNFKKISFGYCSQEDHAAHKLKLESRYSKVQTVKGTRQFHFYRPLNDSQVICAMYSAQKTTKVVNVIQVEKIKKEKKLRKSKKPSVKKIAISNEQVKSRVLTRSARTRTLGARTRALDAHAA